VVGFWLAWQMAKLVVFVLRFVLGSATGWLLIALALGAGGLLLLRSDADYATLSALGCIAAAFVIVCAVEYVEACRARERQVRLRASYAQERRRREQELAAASDPLDAAHDAGGAIGSLNAEFVDGVWVVSDSGKSSSSAFQAETAWQDAGERFAEVQRDVGEFRRGPRALSGPLP
jgi:hypothetical protein